MPKLGQGQHTPDIKVEFLSILAELAAGHSRRDLGDRAERISTGYRRNDPSSGSVREAEDVLAYALARAPATYAAITYVLNEALDLLPGFVPKSLSDLGAGPGTASWAASALWSTLETIQLLDHNRQFLALARAALENSDDPSLAAASTELADMAKPPKPGETTDVVIAAYALTELPDTRLLAAAEAAWARTNGILVLVEPGRPRDYQRLLTIRAHLLAQGAQIVAPCPHAGACPLIGEDWCHFMVRLERTRDHQAVKGATLGYEDEKFSYLILARPGIPIAENWTRILKPPAQSKFAVALELCAPDDVIHRSILKRSGPSFKAAKKLQWGDRIANPVA